MASWVRLAEELFAVVGAEGEGEPAQAGAGVAVLQAGWPMKASVRRVSVSAISAGSRVMDTGIEKDSFRSAVEYTIAAMRLAVSL